jgi:hypothetical protein
VEYRFEKWVDLVLMLFHFEYSGPRGWEALGSGVGAGDDAVVEALAELETLSGGSLPTGAFRCIEIRGKDSRWIDFEVLGEGRTSLRHW